MSRRRAQFPTVHREINVSNAGETCLKLSQLAVFELLNMGTEKLRQYWSEGLNMAGLDGAPEELRMNPKAGGFDVSLILMAQGLLDGTVPHCGSRRPSFV